MKKWKLAAAVGAVVVGACAYAMANRGAEREESSVGEQVGALVDAQARADRIEAKFEAKLARQTAREALDVGDPDSFGRNVRWLGFVSGPPVALREDCTLQPGEDPNRLCLQTSTTDLSTRVGEYRDIARMTLPARSTHSLLCHWLTPTVATSFYNNSGFDNRTGRVLVSPSLTIENEVLNDPALLDPETGEPLNGKVEVFASSAAVYAPVHLGQSVQQRQISTRACIGGYLNKRSLIEVYGLSERQADQFFRKPTTLRLNMTVLASLVQNGSASMAIRFVGD